MTSVCSFFAYKWKCQTNPGNVVFLQNSNPGPNQEALIMLMKILFHKLTEIHTCLNK